MVIENPKSRIQNPKTIKSICLFCSLGCGVAFRGEGDRITALDYDMENPVNHGSLCPKGHKNIELLNHPQRLIQPRVGKREASWDEAASFIRQELKLFKPDEIGVCLSSYSSNEDAAKVAEWAQEKGLTDLCVVGEPIKEEPAPATLEDIDNADALLIYGDILDLTPVLFKRINHVKYGKRGNRIIVVDDKITHTTWFATDHIKQKPATEIEAFANSKSGVIIFAETPDYAVADYAGNKKISFYPRGNALGVNKTIKNKIAYAEMLSKIEGGEIKVLLMLGEDMSAFTPWIEKKIKMLKLVVCADYFAGPSKTEADTSILLPLSSQFEGGGTYHLSGGREVRLAPIAPRVGSKTIAEIMELLHG